MPEQIVHTFGMIYSAGCNVVQCFIKACFTVVCSLFECYAIKFGKKLLD